ncbi:TIGR03960 family B12-binding radical SAM protein [Desulfocicer niacini]
MNQQNIQAILPFVEMPSRYLGSEVNTVKKDLSHMDLTFALAFPDLYEIGTSHFGMQILYTILNQQENIAAERFFTPAPDMEQQLLDKGLPLFSLESGISLKDFHIIGFSLLYELNFTNILTMLHVSGIPFYARDRKECFPLIIGGGPCAFNPEPLADFFDAFIIGDGEEIIVELSRLVIQWKKQRGTDKQELLKKLSTLQGVYVPSFFKVDYDIEGIQQMTPLHADYQQIKRAILPDLANVAFPTAPVVPFGKPVHDRLRLEIARGCSRGCRFCQAGMIYRPVRERATSDLLDITRQSLKETGYSDVSLLSLSTGDYGDLANLMENLLSINANHCTAISLPSVRAGRLTPELMRIIKKVKKTGFTIAPEAGTQRLRDVINKNITEEDIFNTVNSAFELGWRRIKLYFMNGLPTETIEDIKGICDMARTLAAIKVKGKSQINVSFATFIPKAHTPFQRCSQIPAEKSRENLLYLKEHLRHPGINLKWQDPNMSVLEGVWARGDRKLSRVLVTAWKMGCRLDGWSDSFNFATWQAAFQKEEIDPLFYTTRERAPEERLPWAHIDCGISDKFMEKEYQKALVPQLTPDCREDECMGCGICDFKKIQPVLHPPADILALTDASPPMMDSTPEHFTQFRCFYTRLDNARHFGHLELAKIIRRAIRRIGITVKYSKGFSPSMKLSFDNPLPVGMESEEEFFNIHAHIKTDPVDITEKLNRILPRGLSITRCVPVALLNKKTGDLPTTYRVSLPDYTIDATRVENFLGADQFIVEKRNFKGKTRTTDLRKVTNKLKIIDSSHLEIVLKKDQNRIIRPAEILQDALEIPEDILHTARILKIRQDTPTC